MSIHGQNVIIKKIAKKEIEFYTFWSDNFKEYETEKIKINSICNVNYVKDNLKENYRGELFKLTGERGSYYIYKPNPQYNKLKENLRIVREKFG